MMVGKAASFIPISSIFFRIQAVSAVCGAGVIALTARWLLQTCPGRISSRVGVLVAAVALLACPMFVLHGTTPEVYMPTLLLVVAAFAGVTTYHTTGSFPSLLWAAAAASLALGCHFSVALVSLLPLAGWACWSMWKREATLQSAIAPLSIGFVGLVAYSYLPLAASNEPFRNWGSPTNFSRMVDHVSAASIRVAFDGTMLETTLSSVLLHFNAHIEAVWESIGPLAAVGLTMGLWGAVRPGTGQFSARILLSIALLDTLYTVWINPMGIEDRQTGLHTVWSLVALSGLGATILVEHTPSKRLAVGWGLLLAGVSLQNAIADHQPANLIRSTIDTPERFIDAGALQAPPNGIVLAANDDMLGGWNQSLAVDGRRPDIAFIPLPHVYSLDELRRGQRLYGSVLFPEPRLEQSTKGKDPNRPWLSTAEQLQWIQHWVEFPTRPVLWALGEPDFDRQLSPFLKLGFPLSRVVGPDLGSLDNASLPERTHQMVQRWNPEGRGGFDSISAKSLSDQIRMVGRETYRNQSPDDGQFLVQLALDLFPTSYRGWSDLSAIRSAQGEISGALSAAQLSLRIRPDRYATRGRAMELARHQQMPERVVALGEEFKRWSAPTLAQLESDLLLIEAYWVLEQHDKAVALLSQVLQQFPDDQRVQAMKSRIQP